MKESKLANITEWKSKLKEIPRGIGKVYSASLGNPKFKNIAEKTGVAYTALLGTTTVGATMGLIYSFCAKGSSLGKSVGLGALCGLGGEALLILGAAFKSLDYSKTP